MWKISEDDTNFLYVMKINATNRSKKLCSSRCYSLKYYTYEHYFQKASTLFVLALFTDKNVFALKKIQSLYKHLRARINFLEIYGNQACIHKFSIT
jgi:hypothetical protein